MSYVSDDKISVFPLSTCDIQYVRTEDAVVLTPRLQVLPRREERRAQRDVGIILSKEQARHLADELNRAADRMEWIGKPGALFKLEKKRQ